MALLKKLRITPPHSFLMLEAPPDFAEKITADAPGCTFTTDPSAAFDSVHWFVRSQADVERGAPEVFQLLKPGLPVWVYYPKGGSDLNRDVGWDALMKNEDIRWLAMIAFDATWTAFSFRLKTEKDRREEAKPKEERAIFQYIDRAAKTITLPDDLKEILENNPSEGEIFQKLSFSNQCEYLEWVITAKQEKTRQARLAGTIERLRKGLRNPAGR